MPAGPQARAIPEVKGRRWESSESGTQQPPGDLLGTRQAEASKRSHSDLHAGAAPEGGTTCPGGHWASNVKTRRVPGRPG